MYKMWFQEKKNKVSAEDDFDVLVGVNAVKED
jgi:hypothetical protein